MAQKTPPDRPLERAVRRAAADPFFLASALEAYRSRTGMDESELASFLGTTREGLRRMALCRRPRGEGAGFRSDVERIAAYAGASARALAQLLREVEWWEAVEAASAGEQAAGRAILAAREREEQVEAQREEDEAGREAGQ